MRRSARGRLQSSSLSESFHIYLRQNFARRGGQEARDRHSRDPTEQRSVPPQQPGAAQSRSRLLMDFKGQYYCERTFQILVVLFGIMGFFAGYLQQDFRLTFYFLATGGGLSALVCAASRLRVHGSARQDEVGFLLTSYTSPNLAPSLPSPRRFACQIGRGGTGTHWSGWSRSRTRRRSPKRR